MNATLMHANGCTIYSGDGFVRIGRRAIDACPRCTMLGELLWRDHLREVEAAKLLPRKPKPVVETKRRAA